MSSSKGADFQDIWPNCDGDCERSLPCRCAKIIADRLSELHAAQLDICRLLEQVADGLPDEIDSQSFLQLSRNVYPAVKSAHELEENNLFPLLEHKMGSEDGILHSIERLQFEHWEDESFAQEIGDCLLRYVTEPETQNPDALSYMLRGFFEGVRRHIAFESEHVLPLLSKPNPISINPAG